MAVDDVGGLAAHVLERVRHELGQLFGIDADQLVRGRRRIGEGAEDVEDGAGGDLAARADGITHGRVIGRREEEGDTDLLDALGGLVRRERQRRAERLEHIGAAGAAIGAIAVFGHAHSRACQHESRDRADVELLRAVAACANDVDERCIADVGLDGHGAAAHGRGAAGDFLDGFALDSQRGQESANLSGCRLAQHDLRHGCVGLGLGEVLAREEQVNGLLDGGLAHGWLPPGVVATSGTAMTLLVMRCSSRVALDAQEIGENGLAVLGEDALRVELHAVDRQRAVL